MIPAPHLQPIGGRTLSDPTNMVGDMLSYEVVGGGVRPPWWRSAAYAVVALLGTLISIIFSPFSLTVTPDSDGFTGLLLLGLLGLMIAGSVALFWRDRFPFTLTIVAAVLPVFLPLGNTVALIALAALIGRRRGPAVWLTAGLVAVTSTWVVVVDALAQPQAASVTKMVLGPQSENMHQDASISPVAVPVVILLGLGVSIGLGLLVRARREAARASDEASVQKQTTGRLGEEVARRQERERIAREVHDALGHRLSLLNLHAGALEANAGEDPRLEQSAQLVQHSARAAMDDLSSLLSVLREPMGEDGPALPLSQLAQVVQESWSAGQPLNSSVFILDADRAHPTLSRAVYRIVQELLTNARKHAPGESIFLSVQGSPAEGVVIDARNGYLGGLGQRAAGSARGLAGITERAELLGGSVRYGLDDAGRTFRVRVELPWLDAPAA